MKIFVGTNPAKDQIGGDARRLLFLRVDEQNLRIQFHVGLPSLLHPMFSPHLVLQTGHLHLKEWILEHGKAYPLLSQHL